MKVTSIQLILVLLFSCFVNPTFAQTNKGKKKGVVISSEKIPPPPKPALPPICELIVEVDYDCILKINGKKVATLSPTETWKGKFRYGGIILKTILSKDTSIVITKEIELNKAAKPISIEFKDEIAKKKKQEEDEETKRSIVKQNEIKQKKEDEKAQKAERLNDLIADYKNFFSSSNNNSDKLRTLKRQILAIDSKAGKNCKKCDGSGKISIKKKCEYCDGVGEVDCKECTNGKVNCSNCQGIGSFICRFNIYNVGFCRDCGCTYCIGGYHNRVRCQTCNGYGYLTCSTCNQHGVLICSRCDKGEVDGEEYCRTCKGLGMLFE